MPVARADALARCPPPAADTKPYAFPGSHADCKSGSRTADSRSAPGSVLHADSADAVANAGTDNQSERSADRATEPIADGIADTDAIAIGTSVVNAIAVSNAYAVSEAKALVFRNR